MISGLLIVLVAGIFLTILIEMVGKERFETIGNSLGLSLGGLVGIFAFIIAWAVVYRKEIREIPKLILTWKKKL